MSTTEASIVRTPTYAKGGVTPEEQAALAQISKRWIANAMRVDTIDRPALTDAVHRLYCAAGLKPPRVVVVPSPVVMAFAYGAAAWLWHERDPSAPFDEKFFAESATRALNQVSDRAMDHATAINVHLSTGNHVYVAVSGCGDAIMEMIMEVDHAADKNAVERRAGAASIAASPDSRSGTCNDVVHAVGFAMRESGHQVEHILRDVTSPLVRDEVSKATFDRVYCDADQAVAGVRDVVQTIADNAVSDAIFASSDEVARDATREASDQGVSESVDAATFVPTDVATHGSTQSVTNVVSDIVGGLVDGAPSDAIVAGAIDACRAIAGKGGIMCARSWWRAWQGGNLWSSRCAYYNGMRDALKLDLPEMSAYQAWEDCALLGGPRVMHKEFCIISDFPCELHVDDQHRPHNDHGPSHRWRDGWALYFIHGVQVPQDVVEHPESITVARIEAEANVEVRRIMIERYGVWRYLNDAGAMEVGRDDYGILYRREVTGDESITMVRVLNTTPDPHGSLTQGEAESIFGAEAVQRSLAMMASIGHAVPAVPRWKEYMLRVPPSVRSPHEAVAWTFGKGASEYAPEVES